jgi:hypothetical protein
MYTRDVPHLKFGRATRCPRLVLVIDVYHQASLTNKYNLLKQVTVACLQAVTTHLITRLEVIYNVEIP